MAFKAAEHPSTSLPPRTRARAAYKCPAGQPNALLNVWPLPLRHEWHEALNGRAGAAARVSAAPGPRFSRGARRKSSAARRPRAAVARGANRKRRASARPAWHPAAPARLRRKPVAPLEALRIISRRHRGGTCRRARGSPVLLHGGGADSSFLYLAQCVATSMASSRGRPDISARTRDRKYIGQCPRS